MKKVLCLVFVAMFLLSASSFAFAQGQPSGNQSKSSQSSGAEGVGQSIGAFAGLIKQGASYLGSALIGGQGFAGVAIATAAATVIGTIVEYNSQSTKTVSVVKPEIVINKNSIKMLQESGKEEAKDTTISIITKPQSKIYPSPIPERKGLQQERIGLTFTLEDQSQRGEFFRVLYTGAKQYSYIQNQKHEDSIWDSAIDHAPSNLDQETGSPYDFESRFHLQFNAIDPTEVITEQPVPLDCELLGGGTGATGEEALPKIAFEWDWTAIDEDMCDQSNEDAVYCDATQFSIATLKKIQLLREFLQNNELDCPSAEQGLSLKTNVIGEDNIGIELLDVDKVGTDINVLIDVYNNNQQQVPVDLNITIRRIDNNATSECIKEGTILSKQRFGCSFENLQDADYEVTAIMEADLTDCEFCFNNNLNDDEVVSTFNIGQTGILECEPYNTSRLLDFVEATRANGNPVNYGAIGSKENLAELLNGKSYLMLDQYSEDFQKDFDEFARSKSFFDAPQYYLNEHGLGDYFKSSELFKFEHRHGETPATGLLVQPGLYAVALEIEFENNTWELYNGDLENAVIHVVVEKEKVPVPDSPFYYMPFDGLLGLEEGRTGYGLNYEGDIFNLNDDQDTVVQTVNIPSSNPVRALKTEYVDNYKRLNVLNRGSLLTVERGVDLEMSYSPSYATPVIMQVTNESQEAYGFYSVGVDLTAQNVGPENLLWTGIGLGCKDFLDREVTNVYDESSDKHALDATQVECARVAPNKDVAYGLEWCNGLVRTGDVYLKTVVFTPQRKNNIMQVESASDSMELIAPEGKGSRVSLNGVPGIPTNSTGNNINTVEDIFDLVKSRHVCVTGTGAKTSFVWNPKAVYEYISTQESLARESCIKGSEIVVPAQ